MNIKLPFLVGALGLPLLGLLPLLGQEPPLESPQPTARETELQINQTPADVEPVKSGVTVKGGAGESVKVDFEAKNIPNIIGWWEVIGSEDSVTHVRDFRRVVRSDDESGVLWVIAVKSLEPRYPTQRGNSSSVIREPLIRLKWNSDKNCFSGASVTRSDWPVPFRSEVDFNLFPNAVQERLTTELNLNDQLAKKVEEIKEVVQLHRELNETDRKLWAIVRNIKPKEEWKRVSPPNYSQIGDHLVVETEEELKVINTKNGVPSSIRIEAPSNGETRLERLSGQGNFIFGTINGKMLAYSNSARKWGKWPLEPQHWDRFKVGIGPDLMSVNVDGRAIAFFTSNGVWVSPETIAKSNETVASQSAAERLAKMLHAKSSETQINARDPFLLPQVPYYSQSPAVVGQVNNGAPNLAGLPALPAAVAEGRKRIRGEGVLVVETEDGIAGFSEIRGKWDRLVLAPRKDGGPYLKNVVVGKDLAVVVINNELFAFGNSHGKWVRATIPDQLQEPVPTLGFGVGAVRTVDSIFAVYDNSSKWGRLAIPDEHRGKAKYTVGVHTLHAEVGPKLYMLSATTGEWTSPDEPGTDTVDVAPEVNSAVEQSASSSKETKFFSAQIGQLEADSLRAAAKVNELTKQHGADHESVKAARAELDKVLNDALDVRFLREEFRVKELRTRLGRLEQQIGQRKAQRATIIERRADELLNGGAFKWETSAKTIESER